MLWDMHLCVFDVRLSFENRVSLVYLFWLKKLCPDRLCFIRTTS